MTRINHYHLLFEVFNFTIIPCSLFHKSLYEYNFDFMKRKTAFKNSSGIIW